jgi:hypothetical protein
MFDDVLMFVQEAYALCQRDEKFESMNPMRCAFANIVVQILRSLGLCEAVRHWYKPEGAGRSTRQVRSTDHIKRLGN